MTGELTLAAAFVVGLLGSLHCVGMCGGIVASLASGAVAPTRPSGTALRYVIAYNTGRILSYGAAGALAGLLGGGLLGLLMEGHAVTVGHMISGAFMIALGLYVANWWRGLAALEQGGRRLWQQVEPLGRRLLPLRTTGHAFGVGILWGWLPCGLVYSTLAWSLAAGSAVRGGALMLAFGLGTLPMLVALGTLARHLPRVARLAWLRRAIGIVLITFGAVTFTGALSPTPVAENSATAPVHGHQPLPSRP